MRRVIRLAFGTIAVLVALVTVTWLRSMPDQSQRGAWQSETGGQVLNLNAFTARLYQQTSVSCIQTLTFPAHLQLVNLLTGAQITTRGDQLELVIDDVLEPVVFNPMPALPADCTVADPESADAARTFDVFWTAMNEHYAFFDLYGVDWQARRSLAPGPEASDAALLDAMLSAMDGLDDGHLRIDADALGLHTPAQAPDWVAEHAGLNRRVLIGIAREQAGAPLTQLAGSGIFYGLRPDGIGYIGIEQMSVPQGYGESSADAAARHFGDVLAALEDAESLILDLRYNPGGSDSVAMGIAGHFVDAITPVLTKSARDGSGTGPVFTALLHPSSTTPETRNVVLLTSALTGSAAEIFTLAMRDRPNVTTLGEVTSGGLSDILEYVLPNGWRFSLSHQTYLTMTGESYEGIGIPPDVPVPFDGAAYAAGADPVLDAAIAYSKDR